MERKFHVSNRKHISRVRTSRRRPGCIRLFVCPTTGGRLEISVSPRETVYGLKVALARKLRILPAKITLLYKDKVLKEGCIQDYQIPDDSHVTLLPNMESGLSLHNTDKSIMQALENLTETQVSDFLSGRSPLMLAIHMGENMVFVQLQLSMLQGQYPPQSRPSASPVTPATAAVISQTGLSPSTLAEATRCLSQRLHKLHGINVGSKLTSSTSTATSVTPPVAPETQTPPVVAASAAAEPTSSQTIFQHLRAQPTSSQTIFQQLQALPTLSESSVPTPPPSPGAVINSMRHIGRGVYTGTFQGTLDPSLQDGNGQPRRSVNTILHILNDLLVAAPHSSAPPQGQGQTVASVQTACPSQAPPLTLTPPPSPVSKIRPVMEVSPKDDPENCLLRDKMQRIQMMLAQRKEQRRNRRETIAPYTSQRLLQKITSANLSSLSASLSTAASTSVCMAARATASAAEGSEGNPHSESSSDPSSNYCKPNIEQDSLAV
ncbi:hypothetical protein BsWGS_20028 [Bradybaena similaris]